MILAEFSVITTDPVKEVTGVTFWQQMTVEEALKIAEKHNI